MSDLLEQSRKDRSAFEPIAVVEHQQMVGVQHSVDGICHVLAHTWVQVRDEARRGCFSLDAKCVLELNCRIATSFGATPGKFRDEEGWVALVQACGALNDDPAHAFSWILSALYWNHLTKFKLATAWMYTNAQRLQHSFPEYRLSLSKLGAFLGGLSDSGPPLYDGQTFYPEDYSTSDS